MILLFDKLFYFVCRLCSSDIWLYTPTSPKRLTSSSLGKGRCIGWQRSVKMGGSKAHHWEPLPPVSSQGTTSPPCPGQWAQPWALGGWRVLWWYSFPTNYAFPSSTCTVQYLTSFAQVTEFLERPHYKPSAPKFNPFNNQNVLSKCLSAILLIPTCHNCNAHNCTANVILTSSSSWEGWTVHRGGHGAPCVFALKPVKLPFHMQLHWSCEPSSAIQ